MKEESNYFDEKIGEGSSKANQESLERVTPALDFQLQGDERGGQGSVVIGGDNIEYNEGNPQEFFENDIEDKGRNDVDCDNENQSGYVQDKDGVVMHSNVPDSSSESSVTTTESLKQKREEYKVQVIDLVKKVVPDEINNVDAMMLRFKGRESYLVDALLRLEERTATTHARGAVHKVRNITKRTNPADYAGKTAEGSVAVAAASTLGPNGGYEPRLPPPSVEEIEDEYSDALSFRTGMSRSRSGRNRYDDNFSQYTSGDETASRRGGLSRSMGTTRFLVTENDYTTDDEGDEFAYDNWKDDNRFED